MEQSILFLFTSMMFVSCLHQEANFSCNNIARCSCDSTTSGVSLKCVQDNQTSLEATLSSKSKSLHITCNFLQPSSKQLTASIYDDLSELKLKSSVQELAFQFCPLPRESFRSFATDISMIKINKIKFEYSMNAIGILSTPFLRNLPHLEELVLCKNSNLTGLHIDLFQETPNLKSLFLRENAITELYPGLFQQLTKLEVLDLGGNNITHLDSGVFRNLQSLRILNIDNNALVNLTRALFNGIPHLESLDISSNRIITFPPGLFTDLWELRTFQANKNIFKTFPSDLFSNMQHLEVVKIIYHKYTLMALPSQLFANLLELTNVTLRESNIRSVPADLFRNSSNIQMISFTGHKRITSLPRNLFKDCKDIVKLELNDNMLDELPDELFAPLRNLYELNLSKNNFHSLKKVLFEKMTKLTRLDLSFNSLKHIETFTLNALSQLNYLDLSHNLLDFGNNSLVSPMKPCLELEELLLSDNRIQRLYSDWTTLLPKLRYLDLRRNAFSTVTLGAIIPDSLLIDLTHNSISIARLDTSHPVTETRDKVPWVLLNSNPLACNCSNYDLISYVNVLMEPSVYNSLQPVTDRITCSSTGDLFNKIVPSQVRRLGLDFRMFASFLKYAHIVGTERSVRNQHDHRHIPPNILYNVDNYTI
uniref:Protein toll n=1 Tax=Cacopsylla melanoneura TaxID=428564 RepID=A0A8D8TZJ6_9HEMI